jgi:hypothetical protein
MQMRAMTAVAVLTAVIAAALLPKTAAAEVTLGANLGSSRVDGGDFEGSDTGWKVHAGAFGPLLGAEVGYVDFGSLGGGNGPRARAWAPALVLGVPLGMARIYGKGGVEFADVEGSAATEEYTNEDPFFGVGLRFGLSPGVGFRAEYERYTFGDDNLDMAQAGIELNF